MNVDANALRAANMSVKDVRLAMTLIFSAEDVDEDFEETLPIENDDGEFIHLNSFSKSDAKTCVLSLQSAWPSIVELTQNRST